MLILLIGILLTTGVAIDLLKHEGERADLQAALDRGVLAATSLNQTQEIETVIRSYVDNGVTFSDRVALQIDADLTKNRRKISALASYDTDTIFLGLVGLNSVLVPATTAAVEGRENIEISLVLDRSGSMWPVRKIGTLRSAATEFVDIIEDTYGEGERATISLVPFAAGTAAGMDVFNFLQVDRINNNNRSCLQFPAYSYQTSGLPGPGEMIQAPWFHREDCPSENQSIAFVSSDYDGLRGRIGRLEANGFTGTYIATKWGLAMLDPATRTDRRYPAAGGAPISFTDYLLRTGRMAGQASDRPVDWDDDETLKVMVVMTDGMVNPPYDIWWRQNPRIWEGVNRFLSLCDVAKANDVRVFTIAFEAPRTARDQMRACASTSSDFFDVEGADLVAAFEEIAQEITRLRLTP